MQIAERFSHLFLSLLLPITISALDHPEHPHSDTPSKDREISSSTDQEDETAISIERTVSSTSETYHAVFPSGEEETAIKYLAGIRWGQIRCTKTRSATSEAIKQPNTRYFFLKALWEKNQPAKKECCTIQ